MRRRGSVWLPVRRPAAYAGEVMRGLGGAAGLALPAAEVVRRAPAGGVLALRESDPLVQVVREMLLYSTNLTAETVGLRASQARGLAPDGLAAFGGGDDRLGAGAVRAQGGAVRQPLGAERGYRDLAGRAHLGAAAGGGARGCPGS